MNSSLVSKKEWAIKRRLFVIGIVLYNCGGFFKATGYEKRRGASQVPKNCYKLNSTSANTSSSVYLTVKVVHQEANETLIKCFAETAVWLVILCAPQIMNYWTENQNVSITNNKVVEQYTEAPPFWWACNRLPHLTIAIQLGNWRSCPLRTENLQSKV